MGRTTGWIAAATVAMGAALLSTPAAAERASVYLQIAPPTQRYEYTPPPQRGHVWVPGHWQWQGDRHAWVEGYYLRQQQGAR